MKYPHPQHLSPMILAGQMLMPAIRVDFYNKNAPALQRLIHLVKKYQPGGIILFGGNPADALFLIEKLQQVSRFPLLVGADLERGVGGLFRRGTIFPHALAWGAADELSLVSAAAEAIVSEARAMGINLLFAPVLDLVNEPRNPIVNIRGFHSDPRKVAEIGEVFIAAVQREGIAAVAKHFPGHGRTVSDSHLEMPEIGAQFTDLQGDLEPFKAAIRRGVQGLMIAHLRLKDSPLPLLFRNDLLKNYLRKTLQFKGVIFSDALNMYAISKRYSIRQQVQSGLHAGIDIFLMPERLPLFFRLLTGLIQNSPEARKNAESTVERIFYLKKLPAPRPLHARRLYKFLEHPAHLSLAQQLAEKSITCIHQNKEIRLDFTHMRKCLHLIYTDFTPNGKPLADLGQQLSAFFEQVVTVENPIPENSEQYDLRKVDLLIFSIYSRTYGGHRSEFSYDAINRALKFFSGQPVPMVILIFGNPFHFQHLRHWEQATRVLLCYSYVRPSQLAAFKALTGFIPVTGKQPIKLTGGAQTLTEIFLPETGYRLGGTKGTEFNSGMVDDLIEDAIAKHTFPGGVLLIAREAEILHWNGYGNFFYESEENSPPAPVKNYPVVPDTVYDLASLTKVLATTPAILQLSETGRLQLEEPLADFYPELEGQPLGRATVSDLLAHQSGLPAWAPFYEKYSDAGTIIHAILITSLEYPTGEKSVYSDLGFILLGDIVEKTSGVTIAEFCRDRLFRPMGLDGLQFLPVGFVNSRRMKVPRIPPTGFDPSRKKLIARVVNDANCRAMGGAAGHAGLFGNARDVAAIGQLFLNGGLYNNRRHLKVSTVEHALRRFNPTRSQRVLGWDTPALKNSSAGKYFSAASFGHLAFTGPSIWVDPEKQLIVVFLCNRTLPNPENDKIRPFRPLLHDVVVESLQKINT